MFKGLVKRANATRDVSASRKGAAPAPQALVKQLPGAIREAGNAFKALHVPNQKSTLQAANNRIYRHVRSRADAMWRKVAVNPEAVRSLLAPFGVEALAPLSTPAIEQRHGEAERLAGDAASVISRGVDVSQMAEEDRASLPALRGLIQALHDCVKQGRGLLLRRADSALARQVEGRKLQQQALAARSELSARKQQPEAHRILAGVQQRAGALYGEAPVPERTGEDTEPNPSPV